MGITTRAFSGPKAVVGNAVWSVENLTQLAEVLGQRSQQKLMHDAQRLFHTHPWVGAVERTIVGAFLRLRWHIELNGEEVDADMRRGNPLLDAAVGLIERPSQEGAYKTQRKLWGISLRHQGLCGTSFWYLDQREFTTGIPLEVLYINPVRMESVTDPSGNLLGWMLDGPDNPITGKRGQPGVPLSTEEVIPIHLDPPDDGYFGVGIPESAQRKIELSRLADHHIAQLLTSGGRLTGIMAPKQGEQMQADQWESVLRGWRQIVNDPDSAKRLHIVKGAVDFTPTSMSPADMELNDLSRMGRDDVLGTWRVPLSQIGAETKVGLSSGDKTKFDEAALYQGPVQDRGDSFREAVQIGLLDRFQALGMNLTLVIDYPEFDDQTPLFENAAKANVVPMTVNQRLQSVGLDPLDPKKYGAFGEAIFIDKKMVRIDPMAPPEPEPSSTPPTPDMSTEEAEEIAEPKAALESLQGIGERLRKLTEPLLRSAVAELLSEQRAVIAELAEERAELIARKPNDHTLWWVPSRWSWAERVAPVIERLAAQTVGEVEKGLARSKADTGFIEAVQSYLQAHLLERARDIDTTTRQQVASIVNAAVSEGIGPGELGQRIREATTFDDVRAETIARTETAIAQNAATLRTYGAFEVAEVQAIDGDTDAECAARNGKVFPLSEAEGITDHPNGTLDWVPVVSAPPKATILPDVAMETRGIHIHLPESLTHKVEMQAPQVTVEPPVVHVAPPIVNVAAPEVHVPAPIVNVEAPVVNVPVPPKADLPTEVRVISLPDRAHKVVRTKKGEVTGSVETDA